MMTVAKRLAAVGAMCALASCTGSAPNTGVGERLGAKGRIVGYFFDADTGAALADVTLTTFEVSAEVTARSANGFAVLDKLTAGSSYRVLASKEGFVPRYFNVTIGQVPQDAYDAVGVGNLGSISMNKPSGVITGRVEFLSNGPTPTPVANASVIVDLVNNGAGFMLSKKVTTGADGFFTLDGLPASPTGVSISFCVISDTDPATGVLAFSPTCTNANAYSGASNFVVVRPSRLDLNNGDVTLYQGVVRDVVTRLPLSDVSVFEVGKEIEAVTTDANGFYFLKSTSVNRFTQLTFRKAGFSEGYAEFNLGRGNQNTVNMNLYPGGASVVGRLLYANLAPANQAEVRIDLRTNNNINVFKTVKANATGDFTLDGLPALPDGLNVSLTITPWSADPELYPETSSQTFSVVLYPGTPTPLFRQLTSNASLQLVASNTYSGFIGTMDPVQLQLSLPTLTTENAFTLTDSNSGQPMPFTVAYSDLNRRITVTPSVGNGQPLWSEARNYTLQVRLRANNGPNSTLNTSIAFTPRTSLAGANIANRITTLLVDTPDIDSNSRAFTLRWTPLPDAFGYSVYVRTANTSRLPSYVRVNNVQASVSPSMAVNLGALSFTSTLEPAAGQPFAFGQILTFLVVPVDSRGIETDATKGATLELRDVVVPRFAEGVAQLDDGTGGTTVRFVVRAAEPMDRVNPPMATPPAGLTFMSWVVDEASGGLEGTLTYAGSTSTPATLSLQLRDTSGNLGRALSVPVFANALIPNFGFESTTAAMCNASAWTVEANTTCGGCPTQVLPATAGTSLSLPGTQSSYEGVCALSFGDSDATFCGTQALTANLDLSNTATFDRRQLTLWHRFWGFLSAGSGTFQTQFINTTTMSASLTINTSVNSNRQWFQQSNDITGIVGASYRLRLAMTTNNACGTRAGLQVDDLKVFIK